ncbi:MAG: hypothetical protein NTW25_04555 [Candidatus Kapabacteria bacterium]|nr:hypothetical protein [Candidatus Kapabacteria bacterium]
MNNPSTMLKTRTTSQPVPFGPKPTKFSVANGINIIVIENPSLGSGNLTFQGSVINGISYNPTGTGLIDQYTIQNIVVNTADGVLDVINNGTVDVNVMITNSSSIL